MLWARFILTAVMGVALMAWVIFCGIQFIRHSRKLTADGDFVGHVRCEKCGTEYTVKAGDFNKGFMSRYRRVTRTEVHGTAFVNRPYYSYYAKKFDCPCCGKRRYAQVLNINEINRDMREKTLKAGLHWLLLMFIGGMLILVLTGIPISFLDRAARRQAGDMRQQRHEELKERYFGEDTD